MEITPQIIENTICKILSVTYSQVDASNTILYLPQVASVLTELKQNSVTITYQVNTFKVVFEPVAIAH